MKFDIMLSVNKLIIICGSQKFKEDLPNGKFIIETHLQKISG